MLTKSKEKNIDLIKRHKKEIIVGSIVLCAGLFGAFKIYSYGQAKGYDLLYDFVAKNAKNLYTDGEFIYYDERTIVEK